MIDQLYQQLTPELKKLDGLRLPYLFFKKLGAGCMVLALLSFIYLIVIHLFFSFQPIEQSIMSIRKWTMWLNRNDPQKISFSEILFFTGLVSMFSGGIVFGTIYNIQQGIFNTITHAVCPDFTITKRTITNQQIIDTGFFNNENNKPLYTLSKGTISGEIDGLNCEIWDVSVVTNSYHRLMMIPLIGTIFGFLYFFVNYLKDLKRNDLYDQGFKGVIIKCDFNRPLSGRTIILPTTWEQKVPFVKEVVQRLNDRKESDVVHLVDVNFADQFMVYSSDQVEARYILSPEFIETIVKWQEQLKRPLLVSFKLYTMYLAIIDPDGIFEIPLGRSALNPENIKKPFNDLKIFTKMIEEFSTDKRIWQKAGLI